MQKKAICIVVSILLLTTACGTQNKKQNVTIPQLQGPALSEQVRSREEYVPLNFYSSDGKRLIVERRLVTILEHEQRAEVAIQELLNGPAAENAQVVGLFPEEADREDLKIQLESVQISNNVANVNLYNRSGASNDDAALVKARTAIANTLIDYTGVEYVNIFFNGRPINYQTLVLGAMERYEGNPESYLFQIRQQENALSSYTLLATLYFPDETGTKLLPEIRRIDVEARDNSSIANAILSEMLESGPLGDNSAQLIVEQASSFDVQESIAPRTALEEENILDEEIVESTDIPLERLQIQKNMTIQILGDPTFDDISEKGIVLALSGVLDVKNIEVIFSQKEEDTQIAQQIFVREDCVDDIGALVPVYYTSKNMVDLQQGYISLYCSEYEKPLSILQGMLKTDFEQEENLGSNYLSNIQPEDIQEAFLSNKTAVINMSRSMYDQLNQMPEQEQLLSVYSIISTMTEIADVENVQFYVEGKNVDQIGTLIIAAPLMPDRGKIAKKTN